MGQLLRALLRDLDELSEQLDGEVAALSEADWRRETPAPGWQVRHQIAHLAWTDGAAVMALKHDAGWNDLLQLAMADPEGFVDAEAQRYAEESRFEVLLRWRAGREQLGQLLRKVPDGVKIEWFGPPMSATSMATARFMETWAHRLDVAAALDIRVVPDDSIRHVAHLGVRTRDFVFLTHRLTPPEEEFRVELTAPSGEEWTWGPPEAAQSVSGPAYDFCLLATRRWHRDDLELTAIGEQAEMWLDIAQAFAGPPGVGPRPRGGE